jgi:outer membrane protein OmpA-like peptidoglycan-associated protein
MAKNQDLISVSANPEVLTLVGNEIVTDVTVVFPAKYYNPKAIVKVTPMLVFDGGAIEGAPKYFQGEKVKDNYTVISKASGGVHTQRVAFPWDPRARKCTLELKVEGKCKTGDFVLGGVIPVAEGVNTLQQDLAYADAMTILPDDFKRVTHETGSVNIMYQVNSSNVRPGELSKEQTKLFEEFIRENENRDRVTLGNIQARGYASPEGPEGFNDQLSQKRSQSGRAAIEKQLKGVGVNYDVASYGEDWEGFKELVEASNMRDKAMIIQVLNMYSSAAQRDIEIKNMSAVFEELKQNILPELRRTQMLATTDIQGKTDAELTAAANNNISSLNLEETLFAATLFPADADKARIYKSAADRFNDARAWNNIATALAGQGDWAGAENALARATQGSSNPAMVNNLALAAMAQGKDASRYLSTASAAAKALAEVSNGNYAAASRGLEGYNKAVADVLGGNLSAAKNALVGDASAAADYLRGVIAAKEGDAAAAAASVKAAIAKEPALRAKALADVNLKSIVGQL